MITPATTYYHETMLVCPKCGCMHCPPEGARVWDWHRWFQCARCRIVLCGWWIEDKERFETDIQEGDDPYCTRIIELQEENERREIVLEQERIEYWRRKREEARQKKRGVKPFDVIPGGKEDNT